MFFYPLQKSKQNQQYIRARRTPIDFLQIRSWDSNYCFAGHLTPFTPFDDFATPKKDVHCALAFHFPLDEFYGAGIDTVCTYEPGISIQQRDISQHKDNNAIVKDGMNILRIKSFIIDKALSMSFT